MAAALKPPAAVAPPGHLRRVHGRLRGGCDVACGLRVGARTPPQSFRFPEDTATDSRTRAGRGPERITERPLAPHVA
jgi:hypothetical protein